MQRFTVAQRRERLAWRHHLATPAESVEVVACDLVGLHATDPVSVFVAARARTSGLAPADLEKVLYDDRSLVRILGMRRTMFVVPADLMGVVEAAAGRALAGPERRRVARWLEEAGVARDGAAWLDRAVDAAESALRRLGPCAAVELAAEVPQLQQQLLVNEGKKYEGTVGVASRALLILAMEGRVVRGRPRGSWTSTQYRWVTTREWLGEAPALPPAGDAAAELARRWLATFGPATFDDLKWWTGWTVRQTREALAAVAPVEVDMSGATGLLLPGDNEPPAPVQPWVALLPALDPTVMGWKERDWYLGEHRGALFDRNGNAGPTVWCDGRVVGGWAQRRDGEIAVRLLTDVGAAAGEAIAKEAVRLAEWFGDVRFTPRFRTSLERELAEP